MPRSYMHCQRSGGIHPPSIYSILLGYLNYASRLAVQFSALNWMLVTGDDVFFVVMATVRP